MVIPSQEGSGPRKPTGKLMSRSLIAPPSPVVPLKHRGHSKRNSLYSPPTSQQLLWQLNNPDQRYYLIEQPTVSFSGRCQYQDGVEDSQRV